ncbi:MAG: DUF4012 domain-containing protein [Candidatus Promineifilaceae bacterium]|nr:DUF4012 domain-containing protein [Candidatus Promineifilaceae bacterium]
MTDHGKVARQRRLFRILLLSGFVLVLLWAAISTVRLLAVADSLRQRQEAAEGLLANGIWRAEHNAMQAVAVGLRQDVLELQSIAGPLVWLGPYFGWVPEAGPLLANAPALLDMADAGSRAALAGSEASAVLLALTRANEDSDRLNMGEVAVALADIQPSVQTANLALKEVAVARERLVVEEQLPWRVRQLLAQYDRERSLIEDWLAIAAVMPSLLPADQTRNYLIMAQNEDELRPTGGFISGAGVLRLENGHIVSIDFDDANLVDAWQTKPYPEPPAPLQTLMGSEMFLFRDANYWPDFPHSAEQAMRLFEYGQELPLDGVIAIDQRFVQLVLEVTGPIGVPELEQTVSANSVIEQIRAEWEPSGRPVETWMANRKSFMGPLANAMLQQLLNRPDSFDPVYLLRTLHAAFEQRHLQLYMRNDEVAATLHTLAWDGHQVAPVGWDYLQVIDYNIGFNKVGANVVRATEYDVTIDESGDSRATVRVSYENQGRLDSGRCQHGTDYSLATRYTDLANDCYWNFVRVYSVSEAELTTASEHPLDSGRLLTGARWSGQAQSIASVSDGTVAVGNVFVVAPGEHQEASFTFWRPKLEAGAASAVRQYRLYVQKQAGLKNERVRVKIELPAGATVLETEPLPTTIDGQTVRFESDLTVDRQFVIEYRMQMTGP